MRKQLLILSAILIAFGFMAAFGSSVQAETHVVQMLNKHPENKKLRNVFLPRIVNAKVGDTIKFVAADKGHYVASIKGMQPEGVEPWKSKLNKDFEFTVTKEGIYGYQCPPHYGLGMVGLIVVGEDKSNLELAKAKKHRGKAKKAFTEIFREIG